MGEEQNGSESVGAKRKVDGIELAKLKAQEFVARIVNDAEIKRPRLQDSSISTPAPSSVHPDTQKLPDQPKENSQSGLTPLETYPVSNYSFQGASKKMDIPNGKVGVIIGKAGETIKYLQFQSGARIQVAKDTEVDQYSQTRAVELTGTAEQISRAEQLITDVIAKTDAGVSGSFAAGGLNSVQLGAEQFVMKIPNHKVARVIGKGGETIKSMQSRSGARIQVIPLHLPPGDTSTERNVHINGTQEQIELAKGLVNEVIGEVQQNYYGSGKWVPPTQPSTSQPGYGYTQPGVYPTPPPAYYGSYPPQPVGWAPQPVGWDQSNLSAVPQQNTGTNYYGQPDQTGSAGAATNLSYGQTQTTNVNYEQGYSHQPQSYVQNIPAQVTQHETHATSGYGPPNVSSQLEGTTPLSYVAPASSQAPAYQGSYGQSPAIAPTTAYGPPSYPNPLPLHSSYDQTGYTQSGYVVQPPTEAPVQSQPPVYGQAGYPPQPSPIQSSYYQGTSVYVQTHPQVQAQPQPPMSQPVFGQAGYPPQQPQSNYYQGTTVYGQTQLPQAQLQSQSQPQPQVYTASVAYGAERNGNNSAPPNNATGSAVQEVVNPQS